MLLLLLLYPNPRVYIYLSRSFLPLDPGNCLDARKLWSAISRRRRGLPLRFDGKYNDANGENNKPRKSCFEM